MYESWPESVEKQCTTIEHSELNLKKDFLTITGSTLIESILVGRVMLNSCKQERDYFLERIDAKNIKSRKARDVFILCTMVEEPTCYEIFNLVKEYELDVKASDIAYLSGFLALNISYEEIWSLFS